MYVERMEDSVFCDDFKVAPETCWDFTGISVRSSSDVDACLRVKGAFGVVGHAEIDRGLGVDE